MVFIRAVDSIRRQIISDIPILFSVCSSQVSQSSAYHAHGLVVVAPTNPATLFIPVRYACIKSVLCISIICDRIQRLSGDVVVVAGGSAESDRNNKKEIAINCTPPCAHYVTSGREKKMSESTFDSLSLDDTVSTLHLHVGVL